MTTHFPSQTQTEQIPAEEIETGDLIADPQDPSRILRVSQISTRERFRTVGNVSIPEGIENVTIHATDQETGASVILAPLAPSESVSRVLPESAPTAYVLADRVEIPVRGEILVPEIEEGEEIPSALLDQITRGCRIKDLRCDPLGEIRSILAQIEHSPAFSVYSVSRDLFLDPRDDSCEGALWLGEIRSLILSEIEEIAEEILGDVYADRQGATEQEISPLSERIQTETLSLLCDAIQYRDAGRGRISQLISDRVAALPARSVWTIAADLALYGSPYAPDQEPPSAPSDPIEDQISDLAAMARGESLALSISDLLSRALWEIGSDLALSIAERVDLYRD